MPATNTTNNEALLPPWTYHSSEFLQLEKETLFKASWLFVGHVCEVPDAGDYITFDAFDERIMIVRNETGDLNAFHNLCRHRGGRILDQRTGRCDGAMTCPFHGWRYSFDGKLQGVPAARTFPGLQKDTVSLASIALEVWLGFIFIKITSDADATGNIGNNTDDQASVAALLAPIKDEVLPYNTAALEPYGDRYDELVPYNWKVIHDIDNEGYHVPIGHPSLQQLYGHDYRDYEEDGFSKAAGTVSTKAAKLWSVRHYQNMLPAFDHLPESAQRKWLYIQWQPNAVVTFYPEMVEVYMTLPVDTGHTRFISQCYALPDARREVAAARYLNYRINRITGVEDEQFVKDLSDGLKSSAWQPPMLSELEAGVLRFHQYIRSRIPVAALQTAPPAGETANVNRTL